MNKIYVGRRDHRRGKCEVFIVEDGIERELPARLDIRNHSPTGFEWGYEGSGPAQLALAICADVLGDDVRAVSVYQLFKRRLIATCLEDRWQYSHRFLLQTIEGLEVEQRASDPDRRWPPAIHDGPEHLPAPE